MKGHLFGLGAIVGAGLMFVLMHGEVEAKDRDMMEMMELVVLSQKFKECRKNKDDEKRLGCFDNLNEKVKVQMEIFQHALDFKVPKENWYELQEDTTDVKRDGKSLLIRENHAVVAETITAKKRETQGEYQWWEDFLIDAEKVMEKIGHYLE